jgi:di/tricarboxylate transporter
MIRTLIRLAILAGVFYFVFPAIPGVSFHGNFVHALLAGALFAFFGWIVEFAAVALSTIITVGTLGLALVFLVPAWLFGFWLIPAIVLRMVAHYMPETLSFAGWMPAIWCGLVMLLVGVLTSGDTYKRMQTR